MNDVQDMLSKQSQWQRDRANLSWADKLRMAQQVSDSISTWRMRATAEKTPNIVHESQTKYGV